ncbi:unnamed protein product [Choristocarpus tenellus]
MAFGNAVAQWLYIWMTLQLTVYDLLPGGMPRTGPSRFTATDESMYLHIFSELMGSWKDSEMEFYIPQLVSVLVKGGVQSKNIHITQPAVSRLSEYLLGRCRGNMALGTQLLWQLEAMSGAARRAGLGQDVMMATNFRNDYRLATSNGEMLPTQLRFQRLNYCQDDTDFVRSLTDLSFRLARLPDKIRLGALDSELGAVNKMLLRRMHTRGQAFRREGVGREWWSDADVAAVCPEAAHFAVHLPLRMLEPGHPASNSVLRVLRLTRDLCRVLPSKERAPYLVVAEVLQTSLGYGSDRLYTMGGSVGVTAADIVHNRAVPRLLQEELLRSQGEDGWVEPEAKDVGKMEGEEADCAFFDRAFHQYLTAGDPSSPLIQKMKKALGVFGTLKKTQEHALRQQSPFGRLKGWNLAYFIVKAGDDMRQEALAMQVICLVDHIFKQEGLSLRLRPYSIMCCGDKCGLVECITDAKSIDHIKKSPHSYTNIKDFFEQLYMGKTAGLFGRAVDNFVRSLAGYSIITYMLQVKDRHNGNIMIDKRGHIIHIDFGFILGSSPGIWKHETAPFKLTQEYVDIMGGPTSEKWDRFRELFLAGFKAVQCHLEEIEALVWAMVPPNDRRGLLQLELLRKRFLDVRTDQEILALVDRSFNSWTTQQYDMFQYMQNGIAT